MSSLLNSKKVLKFSAKVELRSPLLLRSGRDDIFSDSTIERTSDGNYIHINGYVWSSLLRRALSRLKEGSGLSSKIGKYRAEVEGASPLWCESSFIPLEGLHLRYGNVIDRKFGSTKEGLLFVDEIAPPGLTTRINFNYFLDDNEDPQKVKTSIIDSMKVISTGIENIGGGWSYGFGRLSVTEVKIRELNLESEEDRSILWRFDSSVFENVPPQSLDELKDEEISRPWAIVTADAVIPPGQLLTVRNSYPVFDRETQLYELPDSFVYRGYRIDDGNVRAEIVIPGRAIRQGLFCVEIERKLRSKGFEVCDSLAQPCALSSRKSEDTEGEVSQCLKCVWFGSTEMGGLIAVMDASLLDSETTILNRIQLCEHSMQNVNLFSEEFVTKGRFSIEVVIDLAQKQRRPGQLLEEVNHLLNQMVKGKSPDGWYRLGGSSTSAGQIEILGEPKLKVFGRSDG